MRWFDHIEERQDVLGGKPVVKGTQISVEFIMERLGQGWTQADLLASYPVLHQDDIRAAYRYAAVVVGPHADAVLEAIGFEYNLYAGRPKIPTVQTPQA